MKYTVSAKRTVSGNKKLIHFAPAVPACIILIHYRLDTSAVVSSKSEFTVRSAIGSSPSRHSIVPNRYALSEPRSWTLETVTPHPPQSAVTIQSTIGPEAIPRESLAVNKIP